MRYIFDDRINRKFIELKILFKNQLFVDTLL